jgi:diguanylate cyclase (GGDEF)-like protein
MALRWGRRFTGVGVVIGLLCLVLTFLAWAFALERIGYERGEAETEAVRRNSNLALAFEAHTVRSLKSIDQTLQFVMHHYREQGKAFDLHTLAVSGVIDLSVLAHLDVLDEHGYGLRAPGVNGSDREFFRFHRDNPSEDLLIGKPTVGRVTGRSSLHMTRRIDKPDGSFGGVVLASVDPAFFSDFYQQLDVGREGMIELIGRDGIVRARRLGETTSFGHDMRDSDLFQWLGRETAGSLLATGQGDRVVRHVSYRALAEYPLVIAVGSSLDEMMAASRARSRNYYVGALLASVLIALFGAGMLTAWLRQTRAQARLVHQAHYDSLTELPNRTLFYDRLAQTLNQARRRDWKVAVLFIDVDRFKTVNDTLGHNVGDRLLQGMATRLEQRMRAGDTVARLGGDEFAVILADIGAPAAAAQVAREIIAAIAVPFQFDGQELFVTASVGIATFPDDGDDGVSLMKNADAAMFRAKEAGRNTCHFYTAAMNERAMEKLLLENDLRHALERGEFRLHFQPKASLADGTITGLEALLRWDRPGHGPVAPSLFVPVMEDSGLIVPVGEWVIRAACAQLRSWQQAGLRLVPVAINVSARQFVQDLGAVIDLALRDYGVDSRLLAIEITESDAMENADRTAAILSQLRARRIRIAIDDFGTGYSSLGYLKSLPVDALKLDRSFVVGLPHDGDDASISRAVITMAHSLGLKVVAEGVETEAQRSFLLEHGCDEMQGYLLSRPLAAADCAAWMHKRMQRGVLQSVA